MMSPLAASQQSNIVPPALQAPFLCPSSNQLLLLSRVGHSPSGHSLGQAWTDYNCKADAHWGQGSQGTCPTGSCRKDIRCLDKADKSKAMAYRGTFPEGCKV
ncbi:hypothetical protein MHYP_G00003030 [Metynnis hypsauchen]